MFGCWTKDHKVIDCRVIAARGRESKQVGPNFPKDDVQATWHFFALWARGSKSDKNDDDDEGKSLIFCLDL